MSEENPALSTYNTEFMILRARWM